MSKRKRSKNNNVQKTPQQQPNTSQTNNVSNTNTNQSSNNTKGNSSAGSSNPKKVSVWDKTVNTGKRLGVNTIKAGVPIIINAGLDKLNSTSPTKNEILPYESLWDGAKEQGSVPGYLFEAIDSILSPSTSNIWKKGGELFSDDIVYPIWSNTMDLVSDDKDFKHNVAATARDFSRTATDVIRHGVDYGTYLTPLFAPKIGRDIGKSVVDNVGDVARDYESIKDYSYKNLGFSDYIGSGDYFGSTPIRGIKAGFNNLFSRFGKNRDFYQRGRFSLNEMLSAMANDIENHTDKNSPEYKDLVDKFERFNTLAKSSDFYWNTKKEMDASDLSDEDFLKSKNLTPEAFDYLKQSAHTLHNLGSNLSLNEGNGNKRSDYVEGNYSYSDYTDAVNEAKKYLEGANTDIDTDTLNAAINMGTDVGKAITDNIVNNTTGTTNNITTNENSQSSLTPDYLTEFYKKFDKKYNYDPAKGRFNIWL